MLNNYTALFQNYIRHSNEKKKAAQMLVSCFKKHTNRTLLDCGCGTGLFMEVAFPYCDRILAIDKEKRLSDKLISNSKIEFIKGDFLKLDFKEKFDVILVAYLLWEIPFGKWDRFFKKNRMLLKKDGFLIVIDSYPRSKLDNPFFNFNTNLKKLNEYPDWYEYLNTKKFKYESYPFASQITGKNIEEMYEILRFFFQEKEAKAFYRLSKNKITEDLKSKRDKNQIVINMHHVMDFVYLK